MHLESSSSHVSVAMFACMACLVLSFNARAQSTQHAQAPQGSDLWARDNLFAWGISIDSESRTVEAQADMLDRLGFKQVAYSWQGKNVATFDRDVETFKRHGISILACAVTDANTPNASIDWKHRQNQELWVEEGVKKAAPDAMTVGEMLEGFKRHHIAPELWLVRNMQEARHREYPEKPFEQWTDAEKNQEFENYTGYDPTPPEQRDTRVRQEAKRIQALAELAAPYGVRVGLYKHAGWIGISDNQIAIVKYLRQQGVDNVGIVYQFIHAHDEVEETKDFSAVWKKLQPFVFAVNVTGLHAGRRTIYPILYPSQGDRELGMMRTIQHSGWRGPIGLSSEKGGDAAINLQNNLVGLAWLARKLEQPGSEGPRPFGYVR